MIGIIYPFFVSCVKYKFSWGRLHGFRTAVSLPTVYYILPPNENGGVYSNRFSFETYTALQAMLHPYSSSSNVSDNFIWLKALPMLTCCLSDHESKYAETLKEVTILYLRKIVCFDTLAKACYYNFDIHNLFSLKGHAVNISCKAALSKLGNSVKYLFS